MMMLRIVSIAGITEQGQGGMTYSSRIQLSTETPPQLMPETILPARLSLRGLSRFALFIEMGRAPLPYCEAETAVTLLRESRRAGPLCEALLLLMLIAGVGRVSFAEVDCRADVRLEVKCRREEREAAGRVARFIVAVPLSMS